MKVMRTTQRPSTACSSVCRSNLTPPCAFRREYLYVAQPSAPSSRVYTALTGLHAGLPHAELQLRARRMKRAFDVSFKRKALPPDLRALQKPLEGYAGPLIEEAKARRVERELLNTF